MSNSSFIFNIRVFKLVVWFKFEILISLQMQEILYPDIVTIFMQYNAKKPDETGKQVAVVVRFSSFLNQGVKMKVF